MRFMEFAVLLVALAGSTVAKAQVSPAGELELVVGTGEVVGTLVDLEQGDGFGRTRMTVSVVGPNGGVGILSVDEQGLAELSLVGFTESDCSGQAYAIGPHYSGGTAGFSENGISFWESSGLPIQLPRFYVFTESGFCTQPPIGPIEATPVVLTAENIDLQFVAPFRLQRAPREQEQSVLAVPAVNRQGLLVLTGLLAVVGAVFTTRIQGR